MRAAVCRTHGAPLVIEDLHLADPGEDQVEVAVRAVAICHSDIFYADGAWGGSLPAVYGHEAAGVVLRTGNQVKDLRPGDHVCVTLVRSCGDCPACHRGARSECDQPWDKSDTPLRDANGQPVVRAMNCGAFAERVVVDPSQCVRIPPDLPFDVASLISCGVITGVGAVVNTANVQPGDTVAVVGAGGVGLNAIQGARLAGAARILAIDLLPDKLQAAEEFGATDTLLADSADLPAAVRQVNGGRGLDYVFVTVGAPQAFAQAPALLAKGGAMVLVGMPPVGTELSYSPVDLADGSIRFLGTSMGQSNIRRDIPWLVGLYRQGRLKLDELVSRRWGFGAINDAIADTRAGHARRNVITMN